MRSKTHQNPKTTAETKKRSNSHRPEKTETLSSLLKEFEYFVPTLEGILQETHQWITQARLKKVWPDIKITIPSSETKSGKTKSNETNSLHKNEGPTIAKKILINKNSKSAEAIAMGSAEYLEKAIKELEETLGKINREKDQAKDFARNCFIYLNKIHENTCLGEAGKIMLQLFDAGDLSGNIIFGLIDKAEQISQEKMLPFANKLTPSQSKAINFMVEERDVRIAPTIENLQNFVVLYKSIGLYTPLLKALTSEDFEEAQKIVNGLN